MQLIVRNHLALSFYTPLYYHQARWRSQATLQIQSKNIGIVTGYSILTVGIHDF